MSAKLKESKFEKETLTKCEILRRKGGEDPEQIRFD